MTMIPFQLMNYILMNYIGYICKRNLVLLCISLFCSLFINAQPSVKLDIDWENFMERHDMVWDILPEQWYDAAYMGNGMLGLMIYREANKNCLRLETGNCSVRDHRKTGNKMISSSRLLTGHFELCPVGQITGGTMRLNLWNAETDVTLNTTKGKIKLRCLVHSDRMVAVFAATTEGDESGFTWQWIPASADSPRIQFGHWVKRPADYVSSPAPVVSKSSDGGLSVQRLYAGGETSVCWRETHEHGKRLLWMNISHSYPSLDATETSQREVASAINTGYKKLIKSHRQWWHSYYQKSFVTLDDGVKENFYWIQMYKLASATRADRALIDCTGPWLTVTPWPEAWWNLNVQLTYWPLNASNHLDLAQSLENAIYNNVANLRLNIPEPYRKDALGIGRCSSGDCLSDVIGVPGVSKDAEVGLLTWVCHNLWLIYRHKMDDDLLREKLYPILKGAVNYYLHFLRRESDGKLHLPETYSPEYGSAKDCNFDLALLRWGCQTLIQSAERLHIDEVLMPKWREVISDLTPVPIDSTGLMIGNNVPYAVSHRHFSHMLSVHPLHLLNGEQSADTISLIEKSLATWLSKADGHQGYTLTAASSISSYLGKGNDALYYLDGLFGKYLSVTTMYKESGPVIETPLSGVQCIFDMILQGWGGKIRVFPAMPDNWKNAAFHNLLTEGAFEVSAKRVNGKTLFVSVKSLAGEPCIVETDITQPSFKGKSSKEIARISEGVYQINLRKGETVTIYDTNASSELIIAPIKHETMNYYGRKQEN